MRKTLIVTVVLFCLCAPGGAWAQAGALHAILSLLLESAAPTVTMTSPTNGSTFATSANITVSANAADSDGTVATVQFYVASAPSGTPALIASDTSSPYSVIWTPTVAGTYILTAHAVDNDGNVTGSTGVTVSVITNTAPSVSLTSPANNSNYAAPANITLTASASDSDGTISKVEFYRGATLLATQTSPPYSATDSNLATGSYSFTAKAYDNYNVVTTSSPVVATVINNALPTVSVTSPSNGTTFGAPATIVLTATASDSDGTLAKVEFFHGGTTLIATLTSAPYTYNWTPVAAGTYALTATATDNLNGATTSTPINVTVNPGAELYFVHTDHLNTPRLIADNVGQVVWTWSNDDPYGNNAPNENPSGAGNFTCNLRLPGQYFDAETNAHYNYFRDYDPLTGRYVQSDPIGLMGGLNTYAYVGGDPLNNVDPQGLVKWSGTSRTISILKTYWSRDEYTLESECKCGTKAFVTIEVDSVGASLGAGSFRSSIEFNDHFECPNTMAFAGPAFTFSIGGAIRFGAVYSRAQIGVATSKGGWSAVEGLGAAAGAAPGYARVVKYKTEDCCNK